MKKITFLLFLISLEAVSQNIFRCNNDPSVPVSATLKRTLQEAHDIASDGDIIYVEPSFGGTTYGSLNMTKTLTIIGNGYDHSINPGSSQNWDTRASVVGAVNINGTTGGGSVFMGLTFNGATISVKVPNVTIRRCKSFNIYFYREAGKNASGANVLENHIANVYAYGYSDYALNCYTAYPIENITIKNNTNLWFTSNTLSSGCSSAILTIPSCSNIVISNNVYYVGANINYCMNCTITNNIFRTVPLAGIIGVLGTGSVIGNNVCGTNPCVQGSNNVNSAIDNQIFVVSNPFSNDKDFALKVASPAIGAGIGGVDAGVFSTSTPYVLSGLAPIPQITSYSFNSSAGVYTTSTPMTITLSIKGNN
jgi:hypothetical protein